MYTKKITAFLATLVLIMLAGCAANSEPITRMSKDELRASLEKPGLTIIDVRADRDWQATQWKIKGAVREDPSNVANWKDKYPVDKTLVLYCA